MTEPGLDSLSLWTSFAAGFLSFLSPCVLPLVPGYISYISGISLEELSRETDRGEILKKAGWGSVLFVIGFSIVFTLLGASASAAGQFLSRYAPVITKVAGVLIIFFGLHMTGLLQLRWLYAEKRFHLAGSGVGPLLMGLAFAFGWTPCIGPILAGILALAATQSTVARGTLLLFVYSLGLGIPFILTGLATQAFMKLFNRYKRFIRVGEILSGVLLIFVGVLIFSNRLTTLVQWLPKGLYEFSK